MFLGPIGATHDAFTVNDQDGSRYSETILQNEEGILYADLNLAECIEGKQYHDVAGGYQRFDVFNLRVDKSRKGPIEACDHREPMQNQAVNTNEPEKDEGSNFKGCSTQRQPNTADTAENIISSEETTVALKEIADAIRENTDAIIMDSHSIKEFTVY